eukprot:1615208-Rhodomonas_salina.1
MKSMTSMLKSLDPVPSPPPLSLTHTCTHAHRPGHADGGEGEGMVVVCLCWRGASGAMLSHPTPLLSLQETMKSFGITDKAQLDKAAE